MTQLHFKSRNQQSWNNTMIIDESISMLCDAGNYFALFTKNSEDRHKRPEGIQMQEQ